MILDLARGGLLVVPVEEASLGPSEVELPMIAGKESPPPACVPHSVLGGRARLIRRGARFGATNEDATFPTPNGPAPAIGTIVAAVRTASGKEPYVVGKPHAAMFRAALDDHDPDGAVMVGDSRATGILGARRPGIMTLLLDWEGTTHQPEDGKTKPDLTISSLGHLFEKSVSSNA